MARKPATVWDGALISAAALHVEIGRAAGIEHQGNRVPAIVAQAREGGVRVVMITAIPMAKMQAKNIVGSSFKVFWT